MTEAVKNNLSQQGDDTPVNPRELKEGSPPRIVSGPQNPDEENHIAPGVYETKFDKAQAAVEESGYYTAHTIQGMLKDVYLESDAADSRPVIDAINRGLTEAKIATRAKLGEEIDGAEAIQKLRMAGQSVLSKGLGRVHSDSEGKIVPDVNPAPFMVDEVAKEFDCGKETAAAKIVTALEDAQEALVRDSRYPNPNAGGKRQPKTLTNFWILTGAKTLGKAKNQFIANCGVEVSKGVVDEATTEPVGHEQEGKLIPLVAEVVHKQQQRQG